MPFPYDDELAKKLAKVHTHLQAEITDMYRARRECACDSYGLCAHHAEIANHLKAAAKEIKYAIQCTQRERAQ